MVEIKRGAILASVFNKRGLEPFIKGLLELGYGPVLSTGGTATTLRAASIAVTEVSTYTDFPEMMGGRLKTLHPMVHGGLLGRGIDSAVMQEHGISPIDILVVNLYPFEETIAKPGCAFEEAVEQIDIGGPAMLRSAAKNHGRVIPICDPMDYDMTLVTLDRGPLSYEDRLRLATKVFGYTSKYDAAIAEYLSSQIVTKNVP